MKITRFEVVRIRPQVSPDEAVGFEDPWKVIPCNDTGNGCQATFSDPEFAGSKRMATYYVRAIQEPSKKINADNLRCTYDDAGNCVGLICAMATSSRRAMMSAWARLKSVLGRRLFRAHKE